jgi:hypothetical protein
VATKGSLSKPGTCDLRCLICDSEECVLHLILFCQDGTILCDKQIERDVSKFWSNTLEFKKYLLGNKSYTKVWLAKIAYQNWEFVISDASFVTVKNA